MFEGVRRLIVHSALLPLWRILAFTIIFANAATHAFAREPADLIKNAASASAVVVDHSAWDSLLKRYVRASGDGIARLNYQAFKADGQVQLKAYIKTLEGIDPATLNRNEQFALLANLYNAKTIDIVLDRYPVQSIKDISLGGGLVASLTGGPWKAKVLNLGGVSLSLDDIEHGMLRPTFKDPRVHYAVNCASIGCPNLQNAAFTGDKLDTQLNAAARDYVNHARGSSVTDGKLIVSSIYNWFKDDFGGTDAGVISHLQKYALADKAVALKTVSSINGHAYDWRLNDTKDK